MELLSTLASAVSHRIEADRSGILASERCCLHRCAPVVSHSPASRSVSREVGGKSETERV
eukprot:8097112-Pyramimonas_sp.AAC.1